MDFDKIKGDLYRLMREDGNVDARFTTMMDLYALPDEFPGWAEARKKTLHRDRIAVLEMALHANFGDRRFLPHIQLHEFETLLYCDLSELQRRIADNEKGFAMLARDVAALAPEDINDGSMTAPSKRIIRYVPIYDRLKVRVGAPAAAAIGLPTLRSKCPHFDEWVGKLESLGSANA